MRQSTFDLDGNLRDYPPPCWHHAHMSPDPSRYRLSPTEAASQWRRVLDRGMPGEGKRQENYLPVEVVTALALLTVVDPSTQGWGKYDPVLDLLGSLFKRSPGSIAEKQRNLDGSRPNAGAGERELFKFVVVDLARFFELWEPVVRGARQVGIDSDRLPDLLDLSTRGLEGQDELQSDWQAHLTSEIAAYRKAGLDGKTSERAAVIMARVGQHRFSRRVRDAYRARCGFCGINTGNLASSRMLIASHIKPWRDSTSGERADARNGIAACPSHDVAFDTGLLTVTADGRIHSAGVLRDASARDPSVAPSLTGSLRHVLLSPADPHDAPGAAYLGWHHAEIWRNGVSSLEGSLSIASETQEGYLPGSQGSTL